MDNLQAIDTFAQGGGYEAVKPDLTHVTSGAHIPHSGDTEGGRSRPGRPAGSAQKGGRPAVIGGGRPREHIARLERLASRTTGNDRSVLLAAADHIRRTHADAKSLQMRWAAHMVRASMSQRGLVLTGTPERISEDICDLAERFAVHVYRDRKGRVRVCKRTPTEFKDVRVSRWIGTYDANADYRDVLSDMRGVLTP